MESSMALYINLIPWAPLLLLMLISIIVFWATTKGEYASARLNEQGTAVVPRFLMRWGHWLIDPIANHLIESKTPPNRLTLASVIVASLSGLAFAFGSFQVAGWLIIATGIFDVLDGWVARETGRITKSGGFLDSVVDRYCEVAIFAGLFWYYREYFLMLVLILFAVAGSFIFSYSRALGEKHGVFTKDGFMQRHERFALLSIPAILSPFMAFITEPQESEPVYYLMVFAVTFLSVSVNIGAIIRTAAIYAIIHARENKEEKLDSHPAKKGSG
ncbi:MAG: CDP-alcohol phosphatidyltransferase family protein [Myxococcota bacterium]